MLIKGFLCAIVESQQGKRITMTTQTSTKTCSSCKYWDAQSSDSGACRRKAPQTVVFEISNEQTLKTVFPVTAGSDWCGEYEQA